MGPTPRCGYFGSDDSMSLGRRARGAGGLWLRVLSKCETSTTGRDSWRLSRFLRKVRVDLRRVQWFKKAEHLGEVVWAKDREGTVADEQVRTDRGNTVDVSWDGVDGYSVVQCDSCCDQCTALDTCSTTSRTSLSPAITRFLVGIRTNL